MSPSDSPLSVVTVIPTSTSAGPSVHRPELEIDGQVTRMLVDQLRSIDVDHVKGDPVDFLNRDELAKVELALAHYLGVQDVRPPRSLSLHPALSRRVGGRCCVDVSHSTPMHVWVPCRTTSRRAHGTSDRTYQ